MGLLIGLFLIALSIFWLPLSILVTPGTLPENRVYISLIPAGLLFLAGMIVLVTSLMERVLRSFGFIKEDSDLL
jgi:hypothetical protein